MTAAAVSTSSHDAWCSVDILLKSASEVDAYGEWGLGLVLCPVYAYGIVMMSSG